MDIDGQYAIITGGASGFGLAVCEELLSRNATVAVIDNSDDALAALPSHPLLRQYKADITDYDQIAEIMDAIQSENLVPTILINNAGVMISAPLVNIMKRDDTRRHSLELWQKVLDINLTAAFNITRYFADALLSARKKGVIVNISSISARGNAGQGAYAASKAGLEALTRVWAKELGPFGIRSTAIAPGFFDTKGGNDALEKHLIESWVEKTPLRRQGDVAEIVSSVMYLIQNDYYNGKILEIDGGLVL